MDELILRTRDLFGPTIVIVSHDLDLLWQVCDRVAVLGEGRVLALDTMEALSHRSEPTIASYFKDQRGTQQRAAA